MKPILSILFLIQMFFFSVNGQPQQNIYYNLNKAFETPLSVKKLDLRNKNLRQLPDSIKKFKNLEILIVSSNNLNILPKGIGELKKLKILDLSDNRFTDLPIEILQLTQLKELDISDIQTLNYAITIDRVSNLKRLRTLYIRKMPMLPNNIDTLKQIRKIDISQCGSIKAPYKITHLNKLKSLTIKDCNIDNSTTFLKELKNLNNLETLFFFSNDISDLPAEFCELSKLNYIELKLPKLKYLPQEFLNLSKLETLNISYSSEINIDSLIDKLKQINGLQYIKIQSCKLDHLPHMIGEFNNIRELNLLDNNIKSLPKAIRKLTKLSHIDLRGNPFESKNYYETKKTNKKCNILFDNEIRKNSIELPFANIKIRPQTFIVNSGVENVIKTSSGSKIIIPKNAFLDENGNIVSGDVKIEYEEYTNAVDVFLSGVPMNYKKDGVDYSFISGGMFKIKAYNNGNELFPNIDSQVTVNLISFCNDDSMNVYFFSPEKQAWIEKGSNNHIVETAYINKPLPPLRPNKENYGYLKPVKEEIPPPIKPQFNYPVYNAKLYVTFESKNEEKSFTLTLPNNPPGAKYPKFQYKAFLEVNYLKEFNWVCSNNSDKAYNKFKVLIENNRNIINFIILPDSFPDRFKLSIFLDTDSIYLNASPIPIGKSENKYSQNLYNKYANNRINLWAKIDVEYKKEIDKYNLALKEYDNKVQFYKKELQRIDQEYENALLEYNKMLQISDEKYEMRMQEYSAALTDYESRMKEWTELNISSNYFSDKKNKRVVRTVSIDVFGVWNIDYYNNIQMESILAKFKDKKGNYIEPKFIYVLDGTTSGVVSYLGNQEVKYNPKSETALFIFWDDNRFGYVNPNEFKKYTRWMFASRSLKTTFTEIGNTSLENFRKYIEVN